MIDVSLAALVVLLGAGALQALTWAGYPVLGLLVGGPILGCAVIYTALFVSLWMERMSR